MPVTLTREEAKLVTRRRLLEAAAALLPETDYGGLSASAVARRAGVAQPTFYVHFRDKDDLLRALADEKLGRLRATLREARQRVREGASVEAIRETFRLPLQTFAEEPAIFRLYVQAMHQPGSPLREPARKIHEEFVDDLTGDLIALGLPGSSRAERARARLVAEAMIGQTEALGLAWLDGRHPDLDEIVEVLTLFAVGIIGLDPAARG